MSSPRLAGPSKINPMGSNGGGGGGGGGGVEDRRVKKKMSSKMRFDLIRRTRAKRCEGGVVMLSDTAANNCTAASLSGCCCCCCCLSDTEGVRAEELRNGNAIQFDAGDKHCLQSRSIGWCDRLRVIVGEKTVATTTNRKIPLPDKVVHRLRQVKFAGNEDTEEKSRQQQQQQQQQQAQEAAESAREKKGVKTNCNCAGDIETKTDATMSSLERLRCCSVLAESDTFRCDTNTCRCCCAGDDSKAKLLEIENCCFPPNDSDLSLSNCQRQMDDVYENSNSKQPSSRGTNYFRYLSQITMSIGILMPLLLLLSPPSSPLLVSALVTSATQQANPISARSIIGGSSSGELQRFEVQPDAQYYVAAGQELRMRCLVRNRQGECFWMRNGKAVGPIWRKYAFSRTPEDGDCSLLLRNATVQSDDGHWQCQVTAGDLEQETLQSREFTLTVLVAPERPIIKNTSATGPKLVIEESKPKAVVCEIRGGNPAPQIEWYLDGKNVTKEAQTTTQSGSSQQINQNNRLTQSKLKLAEIKRSMNGKNLTCVGVHHTLNQSVSVELDVQYVPSVSVVQREYSIVEGSPLSISCQVDANPPPSLVNWRLVSDGQQQNTGSTRTSSSANQLTGPTRPGPVLEFERIARDDNQNVYECLAQNSHGVSAPADVKLNVLYAPLLLNTSSSKAVPLGSPAELACIFDGNPPPEVRWHYTDPLARQAASAALDGAKQQTLMIRNVSYRNEGDYHCEARNQINGLYYSVRSSNILVDVFGEPQFLVKSPAQAKAVQGSKADMTLTFCSDPPPDKLFWQFGSIRLDVRLPGAQQSSQSSALLQALPAPPLALSLAGANHHSHLNNNNNNNNNHAKLSSVHQRFIVHPLLPLQRRDALQGKPATCFEATLTIIEAEMTDQRDYALVVSNERGSQAAIIRLRVASPLSPMIMITSAFVTICGLFLCSLLIMFIFKRHQATGSVGEALTGSGGGGSSASSNSTVTSPNGSPTTNLSSPNSRNSGNNGSKREKKHANGNAQTANGVANGGPGNNGVAHRGVVNGLGNGLANGSMNPSATGGHNMSESIGTANAANNKGIQSQQSQMISMASSDTSCDQKQLLTSSSSASSDRTNASAANQCLDPYLNLHSAGQSTAGSSPTPMNHISVDEELQTNNMYRPSSTVVEPMDTISNGNANNSALIYANIDYSQRANSAALMDPQQQQQQQHTGSPSITPSYRASARRRQVAPMMNNDDNNIQQVPHSPNQTDRSSLTSSTKHTNNNNNNLNEQQHELSRTPSIISQHQQQHRSSPQETIRANVGATIAMMNSLAAAAKQNAIQSPSGALNGAINQQLANSRQLRKPGPPKPPKPSIQQRSRFYQQQQQQQQQQNGGGLVMMAQGVANNNHQSDHNNDLAVEYSRIAFPARAEL